MAAGEPQGPETLLPGVVTVFRSGVRAPFPLGCHAPPSGLPALTHPRDESAWSSRHTDSGLELRWPVLVASVSTPGVKHTLHSPGCHRRPTAATAYPHKNAAAGGPVGWAPRWAAWWWRQPPAVYSEPTSCRPRGAQWRGVDCTEGSPRQRLPTAHECPGRAALRGRRPGWRSGAGPVSGRRVLTAQGPQGNAQEGRSITARPLEGRGFCQLGLGPHHEGPGGILGPSTCSQETSVSGVRRKGSAARSSAY